MLDAAWAAAPEPGTGPRCCWPALRPTGSTGCPAGRRLEPAGRARGPPRRAVDHGPPPGREPRPRPRCPGAGGAGQRHPQRRAAPGGRPSYHGTVDQVADDLRATRAAGAHRSSAWTATTASTRSWNTPRPWPRPPTSRVSRRSAVAWMRRAMAWAPPAVASSVARPAGPRRRLACGVAVAGVGLQDQRLGEALAVGVQLLVGRGDRLGRRPAARRRPGPRPGRPCRPPRRSGRRPRSGRWPRPARPGPRHATLLDQRRRQVALQAPAPEAERRLGIGLDALAGGALGPLGTARSGAPPAENICTSDTAQRSGAAAASSSKAVSASAALEGPGQHLQVAAEGMGQQQHLQVEPEVMAGTGTPEPTTTASSSSVLASPTSPRCQREMPSEARPVTCQRVARPGAQLMELQATASDRSNSHMLS